MKLADAYKIGNSVVGYVKCTYAMIYDTNNGKLWSFQRHHAVSTERQLINTLAGVGDPQANADAQLGVAYETPICVAVGDPALLGGNTYKNGNVAVRLTEYAIKLIWSKIAYKTYPTGEANKEMTIWIDKAHIDEGVWIGNRQQTLRQRGWKHYRKFMGEWKVWETDDYLKGDKLEKTVSGDYDFKLPDLGDWGHYEIVEKPVYRKLNKEKFFADMSSSIVWVREVAIDWIPQDIEHVYGEDENGNSVPLDELVQASEEKLQRAKNMLYIAGASNVLGMYALSVPATAAAWSNYSKAKKQYDEAKEQYDGIYDTVMTFQRKQKDEQMEREIEANKNTYETDFPDGVQFSTILRVGNLAKVAGPVGKLFRVQASLVLSNTSENTYTIHSAAADCYVLDKYVSVHKLDIDFSDLGNSAKQAPQEVKKQYTLRPGETIEIKLPGGVTTLGEEGDDELRRLICEACGKRLITSCPKKSLEDIEKANILFTWSQGENGTKYTCKAQNRPGVLRYCGEAFYPKD